MALRTLDAVGQQVAAVKPQAALFEQFGSAGVAALARVVEHAKDLGVLCIMDAKRGDIGSTMAAYARAAFDRSTSDTATDALTVSPFLGWGSLAPALDLAHQKGGGIFVLALTSNPEGGQVQLARTPDAENGHASVAAQIIAQAAAVNSANQSSWASMGSVGLVVGATIGERAQQAGANLTEFNGPFLVPGVGAQGGKISDLQQIFGPKVNQVLVNVSRGVLECGPGASQMVDYVSRLREEFTFLH